MWPRAPCLCNSDSRYVLLLIRKCMNVVVTSFVASSKGVRIQQVVNIGKNQIIKR